MVHNELLRWSEQGLYLQANRNRQNKIPMVFQPNTILIQKLIVITHQQPQSNLSTCGKLECTNRRTGIPWRWFEEWIHRWHWLASGRTDDSRVQRRHQTSCGLRQQWLTLSFCTHSRNLFCFQRPIKFRKMNNWKLKYNCCILVYMLGFRGLHLPYRIHS